MVQFDSSAVINAVWRSLAVHCHTEWWGESTRDEELLNWIEMIANHQTLELCTRLPNLNSWFCVIKYELHLYVIEYSSISA